MIRKANLLDTVKLHQLTSEELEMEIDLAVTESQLIKMMNDPEHHLVLVYEDEETQEVCGYVHAEVCDTLYNGPIFQVMCIAVDRNYERYHIGQTLLNVLEGESIKRQYHAIQLEASEHRFETHHFFESIGYHEVNREKKFRKYFKS